MSLQLTSQRGHWNADNHTVRIPALDGQKSITVAVSEEALMDARQLSKATAEELINIAEALRPEIQEAADRAYRAGRMDTYKGVVLVTTRDLNG